MPTQGSSSKAGGSSRKNASHAFGHLFGQSTRKTGLDADWNQVQPTVLHSIIWAVSQLSGSVTFGTTKNGQAYTIKVYLGAPYDPMYYDGDEEGRARLAEWADQLVAAVAEHA